jgi:hypothetical protein
VTRTFSSGLNGPQPEPGVGRAGDLSLHRSVVGQTAAGFGCVVDRATRSRPHPGFQYLSNGTVDATDLVLDAGDGDFAATALQVASVVRCTKLMTLDRTLLTGRLGQPSQRLVADVDVRLKAALDLL